MIPGLGHHLLESTAFAMSLALLPPFFMRNRGAAARHAVWLIAATKFAVPFALFSAVGAWMCQLLPTRQLALIGSTTLSNFLPQTSPSPPNIGVFSEFSAFLTMVWLGGACVMLGFWVSRLLASTHPTLPATDLEKESLAKMQIRIGAHNRVRIRRAKSKIEPGLVGIWRPTILIPPGLSTEMERAEFEAILLHELAHAKRLDNFSSGFAHALVCLFWFHPLLWWIERKLIAERELACDEMVIRFGANPEEYVAGILKVCRFHLSDAAAGACGISGSDLKSRMEVIMSYRPHKPDSRVPKILLGALISLMVLIPLVGGFLRISILNAQTSKDNKSVSRLARSQAPVNCVLESKNFLEGSVIQYEKGDQQLCVKDGNGNPMWVRTDKTIRKRSSNVVILPPPPPPIICEPEPSSDKKFCSCKGYGIFSEGSEVSSPNGDLSCFRGEWWRPVTPAKTGQK